MSLRLARQQPCAVLSAVGVETMELVETWLVTARPLQSTGGDGTPAQETTGDSSHWATTCIGTRAHTHSTEMAGVRLLRGTGHRRLRKEEPQEAVGSYEGSSRSRS